MTTNTTLRKTVKFLHVFYSKQVSTWWDGSAFVQFSKNNNWLSFETFALADVSQIKNGKDVILSYHHWIKGSVSQLIQIIWGMRLSFCVISLHGLFQFCLLLLKCMNVCSVMHCYELHISMLCAWIFIIVGWKWVGVLIGWDIIMHTGSKLFGALE